MRGYAVVPELPMLIKPLFAPRRYGRLLRHNGAHELPNMVPGQQVPDELRLSAPELERGMLAVHWHTAARTEGGAVASFERLSRELAVLGAPGELIRGAHQGRTRGGATRRGLQPALRAVVRPDLGGRGAGRASRWQRPSDEAFAALARETLEDGLLSEGAGAQLLLRAARTARDQETRDTLSAIARDEDRHTKLGWATLDWLWREGPAAGRDAIRRSARDSLAARDAHEHRRRSAAARPVRPALSPRGGRD